MKNRIVSALIILCLLSAVSAGPLCAQTVKLTVNSEPPGATVAVDRIIRGSTPITLDMEKGEHLIRVSIDENWKPFIETRIFESDETLDIKLQPKSRYSYQKGREAFEKGNYKEARENFEASISEKGKIEPEAYFFLAIMDRMKGDGENMEKNLKKYIELNPPSGEFIFNFPQIYPEPGNYGIKAAFFLLGEYYKDEYRWGDATTHYKLAIPGRERFIDKNIRATFDNIKIYREKSNQAPKDYSICIQLAYLFELKGMLFQSMIAYRDSAIMIFEQSDRFMEKFGVYLKKQP